MIAPTKTAPRNPRKIRSLSTSAKLPARPDTSAVAPEDAPDVAAPTTGRVSGTVKKTTTAQPTFAIASPKNSSEYPCEATSPADSIATAKPRLIAQ
jgi:hypothetical protein